MSRSGSPDFLLCWRVGVLGLGLGTLGFSLGGYCGLGDFCDGEWHIFVVEMVYALQHVILSVRAEPTRSAAKELAAGRHR